MTVGIHRAAVFPIETGRIAEQKPELRVVRCRLRGALCIIEGMGVIAAVERLLRSARQSSVADVGAPAELLRWVLRSGWLVGLDAGVGGSRRSAGVDLIGLGVGSAGECRTGYDTRTSQ